MTLKSAESGIDIQYRMSKGEMTIGYVRKSDFEEWQFTEANPLVGVWGRQTELGIAQLGFITLDTEC